LQALLTEVKRNGEIGQIVSVHRNALADSLKRGILVLTRRQRVILERSPRVFNRVSLSALMLCLIMLEAESFVIPRGNANPLNKEYEKSWFNADTI